MGTARDSLRRQSMYEIRVSGAKGLGVFAKSFIPRGTRIFSERPLLGIQLDQDAGDIYAASNLLSLQDRQRLMKLSAHITTELSFLRWSQAIWYKIKRTASSIVDRSQGIQPLLSLKDHVIILSIFRSNAFSLGSSSPIRQAVFRRISRINHSCVPNAQGNFHDILGSLNVHATRDIQVGEELTLNYLQEEGAARESRQSRLLSGYGFTCDCPACDLASSQGRLGEKNRLQMHQKLAAFAAASERIGDSITQKLNMELQTILSFILLLEGENIAGRELSTLYLEATKLNEELGNYEEALYSAERALDIDKDCLGTDHALYLETLETVQSLKLRTESKN